MAKMRWATALAPVLGTAAVVATVGALVLGSGESGGREGSAPDARLSAQSSDQERMLREVAAAASARRGEVMPPCPKPQMAQRLKAAGIEFGPCDPLPEAGQSIIVPEARPSPTKQRPRVVCISIKADRGPADLSMELGCGRGAKLLDSEFLERHGRTCMRVRFRPSTVSEPVVRINCGRPYRGDSPRQHE